MTSSVSVVIPCYNHAHYVCFAIESILAQTFGNWEAIIVDDGSTDDTPAVVAQFTDPRVRYIRQENQGLSAARNTGIGASQGKYLAFLDADDEVRPRFLECCVAALAQDDTLGGVFTLAQFIDPQGMELPQVGGQAVSAVDFRGRLMEGGFFPPCAVLVRADLVRAVGLFDTQLTSLEDWDLWLRLSKDYPMQGIPEALARYRVYPGSMSTNVERMHTNRVAVLTKYLGSLDDSPDSRSDEKRRAYGFAYRCTAIDYIQQGNWDAGWRFLEQALSIWPDLLERLDTFYELACGDQPRGYRGRAEMLDIERNAAEVLKWLESLFAAGDPRFIFLRRTAYSNAYLALGMLSDQAGRWTAARRYLFRAVRGNLRLLNSATIVRRLLKLCIGYRVFKTLRRDQ
ncbi:MAG: glycosyltransferase family 2 protein [Anaerolineae bacterium]|nr:glycosyltransferase family 2 protein [Anaerolineae bacterium]